jgi:predicted lipoprotein with Yx(FWY)xxD motif
MTRNGTLTRTLTAAAAAAIAAAAVAGCGGGGDTNAATADRPARTAGGQAATLALASTGLGPVLVNAQGRTLYLFKADHGTTSACSGACAQAWPPLLASGEPKAGTGVQTAAVTTIKRSAGQRQVSYHGHPLYTYVGDQKPGDTTGQGSNGFGAGWFAVTASGAQASGSGSGSGSASGY